jgi:hypothetical protein
VSCRESIKASVKVTLTGPDGKVLKVIEGESPDPFSGNIFNIITLSMSIPMTYIPVVDPFGYQYRFDLITPSPATSLGYLIATFCFNDCPNTGSTPPNGPGIWLFSDLPNLVLAGTWLAYVDAIVDSPYLITGLSYSRLVADIDVSSPSSPGDLLYYFPHFTQSITNTLSSPVNVYTIMLVSAVYGTLSASPVYMPITYYVFSPPIVLSPGVTMTVRVTISIPYGIAVTPVRPPARPPI